MEFKVNSTSFCGNIDNNDQVDIQSYNKIYHVIYNHHPLSKIIENEYETNDFIVIDRNVYHLDQSCLQNIDSKYVFIFDALESNKNMESVLHIVDLLFQIKFNKKNKLLVIGGGITQDVGGFVSAIYKRGMKWTLVPTTILSMTDSCIGGKVGVNRVSKNMLGLFCAPNKVIISDFFINSLKNDDVISGIGEALKLSLIGGETSYQYFKDNYNEHNTDYINLIKMSTSVKKLIIEADELETNERRVLNYGHTFGHALENASNYFIPHGIAITIGMYMINKLFYQDKYNDLNQYMLRILPEKFKHIEISYDLFIHSVLNDKKNDGDNVCFVLLDNIGDSKFIFKKISVINNDLKNIFNELFIDTQTI
jgi:3-dehydroquinate synthase